jgi:hypothetical protein
MLLAAGPQPALLPPIRPVHCPLLPWPVQTLVAGDCGGSVAAHALGAATRHCRIFVARIPPSTTESAFRAYFEQFGRLQDAYMPRDHSKQAYRGIGFVTFASPESVERVMAVKHW